MASGEIWVDSNGEERPVFNLAPLELEFAVSNGDVAIARDLLKRGVPLKGYINDASHFLIHAIQEGQNEMCSLLLAHGTSLEENKKTGHKNTPLQLAAGRGHHQIVKILLSFGANVDTADRYGKTALHIASQEGHLTCVLSLLEAGADITSPDKNGFEPIHHAIGKNRVAIVRALVDHGYNVEQV